MPKEENSITVELNADIFTQKSVRLFIKRDDLMHKFISGNKWRKLKYNIEEAIKQGFTKLLTFGGAYSNHIYATAACGKIFGFETIAVIRGERREPLNTTLIFAENCGMQLKFVSRDLYSIKHLSNFTDNLVAEFGSFYMIPEGGTNALAVQGSSEILTQNEYEYYTHICCCCGTGGTMAGIIVGSQGKSNILGFSVLKGDFMKGNVVKLLEDYANSYNLQSPSFSNFLIDNHYHFGGYAKTKPLLTNFIADFINEFHIPIEHVYTAKMMYGIFNLIANDYFPKNAKILALHTGGLRN